MPYPEPTFISELEGATMKEMLALCAVITAFLSVQHGPDGDHLDLTANSIIVQNGIRRARDKADFGVWVTPAFGTNFFTADTGTWTVQRNDVLTFKYTIIGDTMFVQYKIVTSSVSGGPAALQIKIPDGYVSAVDTISINQSNDDTTLHIGGIGAVSANGTLISCYLGPSHSAWGNSTNNSGVEGQIFFEISRP